MTEKEKKEYRDMLGDDLMEMVLGMGFEEWYDENADELKREWKEQTKEVKPDTRTGDAELDAIMKVLDSIIDESDDDGVIIKEDEESLDNAIDEKLAELAHDVFVKSGTLPEGAWTSIKGAVNPELPDNGSMFAFTVCCNGNDIYVISEDGNNKYDLYKDGGASGKSSFNDIIKALSVIVYKGLNALVG